MTNKVYFFEEHFGKLIVATFFVGIFFSFKFIILWLILCAGTFFLFRRTNQPYTDTLSYSSDLVLSPVTGVVQEIYDHHDEESGKKWKVIRISQGFSTGFDILMPLSGNIENVDRSKKINVLRFSKKKALSKFTGATRIQIVNRNDHEIFLDLVPCILGLEPDIWVNSGDKGRSLAALGYIPFGGSALIFTSSLAELKIRSGEAVHAGRSVLAALKEN